MKLSRLPLPLCAALLCVVALSACEPATAPAPQSTETASPRPEITLISNARIYTFDAGGTVIESGAMAFSDDGEILAIGDSAPMRDAFPGASHRDLGGRAVLPGLIDAHAHLYGLAMSMTAADLVGAGSKQEVIERLQAFEQTLGPDDWLLGHGWDQNDWPEPVFPGREDLDAAFPGRPVWLERIDGHAAWGNSAALRAADRDLSGDWQPRGGRIERDGQGQASGIFIDGAMSLVEQAVPAPSAERISAALDEATRMLSSLGLTGVHEAGTSRAVWALYRQKIESGAFPLRVYAMADGVGPTLDWLCTEGAQRDPSGRLEMRAVKLYADGALGSRGAALLEDYADDPGNRGLLFLEDEVLEEQVRRVLGCGLQVAVHAIGDGGNRQVLDAYERAQPQFPDNPGRHRLEHAQVLAPADLPRLAQLGVIASMQPTHATSDMYWADERLGADRLAGAYAWRSLLESGARLALGSDFPVERPNPLLGIHAAVTRQDLDGWPDGGWQAAERLGREQAVRGFTLGAAHAAFMEDEVGSLEAGKRADFIVLDRDLMQVPEAEIPGLRVLETWVDGQRVYAADGP